MEAWARDDSHGYDQQYRWGERGDFDCSAAVVQAWENAGVPVKSAGASWTGNIRPIFLDYDFRDVTGEVNLETCEGMKRGDVLLVHNNKRQHVAMYCGNRLEVEASINEFGDITGGQPGDQTGLEFLIQPYRNIWQYVLRYEGEEEGGCYMFELDQLEFGDQGKQVRLMQRLLRIRGFKDDSLNPVKVDGSFGKKSEEAVMNFQRRYGLKVDGICGPETWKKLLDI